MPNTIQPQKFYGVLKWWWNGRLSIQSFGTQTVTVTSCTCTGTMASGTGTTIGSTTSLMLTTRLWFWQLSHFSPFEGEFSFLSCPYQPPSILPISFVCSESIIYFLVSSDFVSNKMRISTFKVSNFRMLIRR